MTKKDKSKIICNNLIKTFDFLKPQETTLISVIMDSFKEIDSNKNDIEKIHINPPYINNCPFYVTECGGCRNCYRKSVCEQDKR